jgi:hypothetical protein
LACDAGNPPVKLEEVLFRIGIAQTLNRAYGYSLFPRKDCRIDVRFARFRVKMVCAEDEIAFERAGVKLPSDTSRAS